MISAFCNPSGMISSKRAVGIFAGLLFIFLHSSLILINLFYGLEVDNFVLDGMDNLGYLCTGLLSATIADEQLKQEGKNPPKCFFAKLITTKNLTISSKKFIGVIAGIVFCCLQSIIAVGNLFFEKKVSENIFEHYKGLMILSMVLLGIDIAKPSIQKLQALFKK